LGVQPIVEILRRAEIEQGFAQRGLLLDRQTANLLLELDGYKVLVVQSRDLNDPQAVRMHLRNIARAIHRSDLAQMFESQSMDG
jgi:hypothetical protein